MPATQLPSFTVDGAVGTSFGYVSSRVALPGTPGGDISVRIANLGPCPVAVKLGDNTVVVTQSTGLVILAGDTVYLTIGAATNIAGAACGGPGNQAMVNLATGT